MSDKSILDHINDLVEEERALLTGPQPPEEKEQRLRQLGEQLDQCWDLLRQRRARREFGGDPEAAQLRDVDTVERYLG